MLEAVRQWAFTLVITAAIGGIANYFVLSSENGGMKKYVKFTCAIVALAVMIMPLRELFTEMPRLFNTNMTASAESGYDYNEEYAENMGFVNELAIAKTNELLKRRISDIVYEKTGIKPEDVYIYIGYNANHAQAEVERIIIDMPENEEVKVYLETLFNCDVNMEESKQ